MLQIDDDVNEPALVVRDLGVCLDAELTMKSHISYVASSCFFQLRRLQQIRRSVGEEVTKRLVIALLLSRLDYCNATLAGLSESTIRPLKRVQNAAARLVTNAKSSDHITPILQRLHWLRVNQRILYKLCLLMHLIHTNQCPGYMADMVHLTVDCSSLRSGLRSAGHLLYRKPALKTRFGERLSAMLVPPPGTAYHSTFKLKQTLTVLKNNLKRFCLLVPID
jgi:hypothetical protein